MAARWVLRRELAEERAAADARLGLWKGYAGLLEHYLEHRYGPGWRDPFNTWALHGAGQEAAREVGRWRCTS